MSVKNEDLSFLRNISRIWVIDLSLKTKSRSFKYKMEKSALEDSSLLSKLKKPLGFAVVLLLSVGLGYGLTSLRRKKPELCDRQKSETNPEYQKILEKLQKKFKQEQKSGKKTYSDELIKMVQKCIPLVSQLDYDAISAEFEERRTNFLDDITGYETECDDFNHAFSHLIEDAYDKIVEEGGGSQAIFQAIFERRMEESNEIRMSNQQAMTTLKLGNENRPIKQKLTKELIKQVCEYELKISREIIDKGFKEKVKDPRCLLVWATDKVNQRFGFNTSYSKFQSALKKLNESDQEFQAYFKEKSGQVAKIYMSLFK